MSPAKLTGEISIFEEEIKLFLREKMEDILKKEKLSLKKFHATLPWKRTFEVDVDIEFG